MKKYLGVWLVAFCAVLVFSASMPQDVSAASLEHATEAELDRESRQLNRDIQELMTMHGEMVQTIEKIGPLASRVTEAVKRYVLASNFSDSSGDNQELLKDACAAVRTAAREEIDNLEKMNNLLKAYVKFMFDRSGFPVKPGVNKPAARQNLLATLDASDILFEDSKRIISLVSPETMNNVLDSKRSMQGVIANHRFIIGQLEKALVIPKPKS